MFSTSSNVTNVWENIFQIEQLWMKEAAKMLNGRNSGANNSSSSTSSSDWITLAKRLSYTERDIMKFSSELSPSLALLKDWYESNGQTRYCIDVLVSCLRMLSREDIASMIEYELEPESVSPPIFLSYHHDSQKQVLGKYYLFVTHKWILIDLSCTFLSAFYLSYHFIKPAKLTHNYIE